MKPAKKSFFSPERFILKSKFLRTFFCYSIFFLFLGFSGIFSACFQECYADKDCINQMRCAAFGHCIKRCFVGEKESCAKGFVCSSSGKSCVPSSSPENIKAENTSPTEKQGDAG